jgi:phosphoadenosine phosphosulfate reductase
MALIDAIATFKLPIQLFTLNTGRLHASTVAMIERVQNHYGTQIEILYPEENEVASYIDHFGLNGFYESEDAKKACCGVRESKAPVSSS